MCILTSISSRTYVASLQNSQRVEDYPTHSNGVPLACVSKDTLKTIEDLLSHGRRGLLISGCE